VILNIYKEKGWTSFDVVAKVRGLMKAKVDKKGEFNEKVGHAGTLDPLAEGVLVVLTGNDTKKQNEFMKKEKTYIAEIGFGVKTPTFDLEMLPEFSEKQMSLDDVEKILKKLLPKFVGEIDQKVPPYSAVKIEGKRLYKQARKGNLDVNIVPFKRIKIYSIKVLGSSEKEIETKVGRRKIPVFEMEIVCSSGTYVRSLANDLGERVGTGAVLVSLVRTKVGDFDVKDSKKILELNL